MFTLVNTGIIGLGPFQSSGSASWFDINGDGYEDFFSTNHGFDRMWLNDGDGTFIEVTSTLIQHPSRLPQTFWGDSHGSAFATLYNSNAPQGENALLVLTGAQMGVGSSPKQFYVDTNSAYVDESQFLGITDDMQRGRMPTFFDANGDGLLDFWSGAIARPDGLAPPVLEVQNPDGTFTEDNAGVLSTILGAPTMAAADLTGDGRDNLVGVVTTTGINGQDVLKLDVVDFSSNTPTLLDVTQFRQMGLQLASTDTVLIGDFNGDGKPDIMILPGPVNNPNAPILPSYLLLNIGMGFINATGTSGLRTLSGPFASAVAGDFNNDGNLDVLLYGHSNGPHGDATYNFVTQNLMLVGDGHGHFTTEVSNAVPPAFGEPRSVTSTDVNNDGNLDLMLTTSEAQPMLYDGSDGTDAAGNPNNWITLTLIGQHSIGAEITLIAGGKTQMQEETSGAGQQWAQSDQRVHFGLGDATAIDSLTVRWAGNAGVQTMTSVSVNQFLTINET